MTLCALGLTYFGITFSSALIYKLPPDNHADYVMAGKAANAAEGAAPPPVGRPLACGRHHAFSLARLAHPPPLWRFPATLPC